ncbi:MAG: glycosyltransferase [Chitinophagaceae bacterium]
MIVSICMITYNHQDYIAGAIESIMAQQTNFTIEIIIGEDNSKDRTRQICNDYAQKFPGVVKLIPSEKNVGMMKNFIRTLAQCNGKYVAFLEGDDYWTDPYKLQKQVDFLEKNTEYSLCFHNAIVKSTKKGIEGEWPFHKKKQQDTFETADLLRQWFVPSASAMFRNYPDFVLPDWFQHCKSGDIPFILLLSLKGRLKYLDEIMSVYRVHDQGISSTHIGYDKVIAMIFIYENFNVYTNYKFGDKIREAIVYEINYHLLGHREEVAKEPVINGDTNLVSRIIRKMKKTLLHYGS